MIDALTFAMLSAAVLILAFKVRKLEKQFDDSRSVIAHMLIGTIQGAEINDEGDVIIKYKEDDE